MRRVYISVMVAVMAAILISRIRFIRSAFDSTNGPLPAAAVESSPYGRDSISESAVDTGHRNVEPDRKPAETKSAATPSRPSADD
jgi:hypothetical protein